MSAGSLGQDFKFIVSGWNQCFELGISVENFCPKELEQLLLHIAISVQKSSPAHFFRFVLPYFLLGHNLNTFS